MRLACLVAWSSRSLCCNPDTAPSCRTSLYATPSTIHSVNLIRCPCPTFSTIAFRDTPVHTKSSTALPLRENRRPPIRMPLLSGTAYNPSTRSCFLFQVRHDIVDVFVSVSACCTLRIQHQRVPAPFDRSARRKKARRPRAGPSNACPGDLKDHSSHHRGGHFQCLRPDADLMIAWKTSMEHVILYGPNDSPSLLRMLRALPSKLCTVLGNRFGTPPSGMDCRGILFELHSTDTGKKQKRKWCARNRQER